MSHFNIPLRLLVSLFLVHSLAYAQSNSAGFGNWSQRAQSRESKRWTLQEWLAQKERNALMDQWLIMNSPSPFEFYLKGAYHSHKTQKNSEVAHSYIGASSAFGAYAQAVGVTGEYENNWEENYNDVVGMLNIRILGNSLQTTSLTLHVGQRTRQIYESNELQAFHNLLTQATLQCYITRYFGIQGLYRQYSSQKHSVLGGMSGALKEGGIFLDFKGLRLFGNWFQDVQVQNLNSTKTETNRTGYKSGLQIFF